MSTPHLTHDVADLRNAAIAGRFHPGLGLLAEPVPIMGSNAAKKSFQLIGYLLRLQVVDGPVGDPVHERTLFVSIETDLVAVIDRAGPNCWSGGGVSRDVRVDFSESSICTSFANGTRCAWNVKNVRGLIEPLLPRKPKSVASIQSLGRT